MDRQQWEASPGRVGHVPFKGPSAMAMSSEAITEFIQGAVPFVQRMGLRVEELRPGYVKLMTPLAGNENHIGSVYAGALFTLAEIPGGALFLTLFDVKVFYPVVKEMTIQFLRPARSDVTITLSLPEAEVQRIRTDAEQHGKAEFILEGDIRDSAGEKVARTRGVYQVRKIGI
jgi:thioesterase domain-containing protein